MAYRQISITENYPVNFNNETVNNTVTTVLNAQLVSSNAATQTASFQVPADRPDAIRAILGRVAKAMDQVVRFDLKPRSVIVTGSWEFFKAIMVAQQAAAPKRSRSKKTAAA